MNEWITLAARVLFLVLGTLVSRYLIPWLKEKRLLSLVRRAVEAAEKLAENSKLDKKEYVVTVLRSAGVTVTPTVEAMIEGCVMELDMMLSGILDTPYGD